MKSTLPFLGLLFFGACVKKTTNPPSPNLFEDLCQQEIRRHGNTSNTPIQEYGNLYMDQYLEQPNQEKHLWQIFTDAQNVCRGAYLQLYFDAHQNQLTKKLATNKELLTKDDRRRLMYLAYTRKTTSLENIVFEFLANDPSPEVREAAAKALEIFDLKTKTPLLKPIVTNEQNEDVLGNIILALPFQENHPTMALIEPLKQTRSLAVGQALITMLATSDLPDKRNHLKTITSSPQRTIAQAAQAALDSLKNKDSLSLEITGIAPQKADKLPPFNKEKQWELRKLLMNEDFTTAETLLTKGAFLSYSIHPRNTMLHELALNGSARSISWIVNKGEDLEAADHLGMTPLMVALFSYDDHWLSRAETLLNLGANLQAANGIGETALHIAARLNRSKTVEYLLEKGINTQARDETGRTALNTAMLLGNNAVISLLDKENP